MINKNIPLFLADEIENSLLSEEWKISEDEWEQIQKECQRTEKQLDKTVRKIKELLPPDETKDMDCDKLIELITNKSHLSLELEELR